MTSIEAKYNQLLTENATSARIITQLKAALHQAQIARAATERKYILRDANLPFPCVERLEKAFATSTDNAGLKQAINCEKRGGK